MRFIKKNHRTRLSMPVFSTTTASLPGLDFLVIQKTKQPLEVTKGE